MKKYLFICSVVIISIIISGCDKKEENIETAKVEKTKKIEVQVTTLKKQTYPIWIDFSGKTEAMQSVEVTSKVSGELKKIFFKAGEKINKGDTLYQIDDSKYKAVVEQKTADMNKNIASLNLAIANVNRYKPLVEQGLAPREKFDELIASQKQLEAQVKSDKATLSETELDLKNTMVKASISGFIGKTMIDIGNQVGADNTVLAKIVNSDSLYVNFNPSAKEVSLIKKYKSQKNSTVEVSIENDNDTKLIGNIDFIDNATNEKTGTVLMRAKIINKNNILFPGTFVKIKLFLTDKISFIAIHPNNIGQGQLGSFVYVVNAEGNLEVRQVEISYKNSDLAIVKKGLNEGDKVVVSNMTKLRDSLPVTSIEVANPIKF